MSLRNEVRKFVVFVWSEVRFHFTHFETNEFFLKLAVGSVLGFGLGAFVTIKISAVSKWFGLAALVGFVVFSALEVGGSFVGWFYENGIVNGFVRGVGTSLLVIVGLVGAGVFYGYLALGGFLIGFAAFVLSPNLVPEVWKPTVVIAYIIVSMWWLANGVRVMEDGFSDVYAPPIGMCQWVYRVVR